ncbi:MAG: HAD-IA family hydrolase [Planctomycetes bacterium]|nr:HAD-IA family hydrolase [Planctomycetota bacterium]
MDHIEIVFFDAGGTLIHPEPGVGEVYARAGRMFGVDAPPDALAASFRAAFHAKRSEGIPQSRAWWRDVVARSFLPFGAPADKEALFSHLYEHFARPEAWRVFPGVRRALDGLSRRKYRAGLISNWDERLEGLLAGLGLAARLCPRVISCRAGVEKPDARIFQLALAEAGVEPAHALMVGDDAEADVRGARGAGMRALLLEHGSAAARPGESISRIDELLDLLP